MQEYHYNLVLFKEIKRFWNYRGQLGAFATFTNLFGNIVIFLPFGFFYADGEQIQKFLGNCSEQSGFESSGRDISTAYESGMFRCG